VKKLIFVTGLPGVGKTTLAKRIAATRQFMYVSAGSLIISAHQARERDELKDGDVLDNQAILVGGFRAATRGYDGVILLDGHVMIRGQDDLTVISESVFRELGCDHLVVLTNDPHQIANNLSQDTSRKRLFRTIEELEYDQARIVARVYELAEHLRCPATEISLIDYLQAATTLESIVRP
jgi:adenylate kinase